MAGRFVRSSKYRQFEKCVGLTFVLTGTRRPRIRTTYSQSECAFWGCDNTV